MYDDRVEVVFALRYAVRVLERHASLWQWIGRALKVLQALKELAYNDVVEELGRDPTAMFPRRHSLLRALS